MLDLGTQNCGLVAGNNLRIGISTLGMPDKLRVQTVLMNKYGGSYSVSNNGDMLIIHNYELTEQPKSSQPKHQRHNYEYEQQQPKRKGRVQSLRSS
jgi:hypothetical protein